MSRPDDLSALAGGSVRGAYSDAVEELRVLGDGTGMALVGLTLATNRMGVSARVLLGELEPEEWEDEAFRRATRVARRRARSVRGAPPG